MAITWGTPVGSGNQMRLGYELTVSPTDLAAGVTETRTRLQLYVGTRYAVQDSANTLTLGGDFGGTLSVQIAHSSSTSWASANVTRVLDRTVVRPVGTSAVSFSASLSGVEATPGTARVSGSVALPTKPVEAPADPTNVYFRRVSDAQHGVFWTRPAGTVWSSIVIQRRDSATQAWRTIVTLPGTAGSYADRSTTGNRSYQWRVQGRNARGGSEWVYTGTVYTTPAPPPTVTARRVGTAVEVSWSTAGVSATGWEVVRRDNGVWQYDKSVRVSGASWVDQSPDTDQTYAYTVRATAGELTSGWAQSVLVPALAPPNAPTALRPNGVVADGDEAILLSWTHNATDTTAQRVAQIQWRVDGGEWSTTTVGTASSHTMAAGTVPNGSRVEWQVRTAGAHADWSAWSTVAVLTTSSRPQATLVSPVGVHGSSQGRVVWRFFDAEDAAQAAARVTLLDAAGSTIESRSISGPATTVDLTTRLQNSERYTLILQVMDSSGLWSHEVSEDIDVVYAPPPTADVSASFDVETGTILMEISHATPTDAEVEGVECSVYRTGTGGEWVQIASGLPLDGVVVDYVPPIGGTTWVEVRTLTADGGLATTGPIPVDCGVRGWVYINAGPEFSQVARVYNGTSVSGQFGRSKTLHELAGRSHPVEVSGGQRSRTLSLSWRFDKGSTRAEIQEMADIAGAHVYRDCTGERFVCSMGAVSHEYEGVWMFGSTSFTQIDHPPI